MARPSALSNRYAATRFVVQRDAVSVSSGKSFAGGWVLTRGRAKWGHYQINSGIVGFPVEAGLGDHATGGA
jgi:hypothetical protein